MGTVSVNQEVLAELLSIRAIDRLSLTKEQKLIYKSAYKDITGRYPADGCSGGLCRGIWQIVHNWLAKYDKQPNKAEVTEVRVYDFDSKPLQELKAYATDNKIEFPKNAGRDKMLTILKGV